MNRIMKWIQERKAYSNPTFGTVLILSAMIFPVFQASARLVEPVQSMALNADEIVDALDAVEAGTDVGKAFEIQPVPYRDWIKTQKAIFEALFDASYTLANSDYFLFSSISLVDERTTVQGHNVQGELFDLELTVLTEIENIHDDIPDDITNFLASVNADDYAFTGTLSTSSASFDVAGSIFQADLPDGGRNYFLVIGSIVDSSVIDFLNDPARDAPSFIMDGPEPLNCEQAFAIADNNYTAALTAAAAAYAGCMAAAQRRLRNTLIGCGVAAGIAWASGIGGLVALGGGSVCGFLALTDYDSNVVACFTTFVASMTAAQAARTAAKANAIIVFGSENCPSSEQ